MKTTLKAPWYTYNEKVKALFVSDHEIQVSELYETKNGYGMDIIVSNHKKFLALDNVLNKTIIFGNVALTITLFDTENNTEPQMDYFESYQILFEDNERVEDIIQFKDLAGFDHSYICFKPEVIQFFNDDTSDPYGNWSGIAQDIAKEIFDDSVPFINFCTAPTSKIEMMKKKK